MTPLQKRPWTTLIVLTVIGALARIASFRFNIWPHGDVVLDAAIAESLAWTGRMLVPIVDVRYYPIEPVRLWLSTRSASTALAADGSKPHRAGG